VGKTDDGVNGERHRTTRGGRNRPSSGRRSRALRCARAAPLDVFGIVMSWNVSMVRRRAAAWSCSRARCHPCARASAAPRPVLDRGNGFAERAPRHRVIEQGPAQASTVSICAAAQRLGDSFHIFANAGLNNCARPLLPNTATASARLSSVSRCTRIRPSNRRASPDFRDVVEQIGHSAFWIRRGDDAHRGVG